MTRNLPTVQGASLPSAISPLQLYLREVAKYPLLSPEEELQLAVKHYEDGDIGAAHRLVTSNLRLVVKIANDFRQAQINLLDLIQEGNYGLMQAVKRYNPYKGVKLSSYAAWWIRAYILKYLMDNHSQVKIGTTAAQRKLYYNLKKETEKLLAEKDHIDTKLLAEALDVKEKEVIEMQLRLSAGDVSLDAPLNSNDSDPIPRSAIIPANTKTAEELVEVNELKTLFSESLKEFEKTLKGRDLEVFRERMTAENPLTLQQLGDKYGITRERARQIEAKILKSLKEFAKARGITS